MSGDRDLAEAIHHEIISPGSVDAALDLWQHRRVGASDRADMWRVLARTSAAAIDAALTRRLREAARTGPWELPRSEAQCERMQEALEQIVRWSEAYPLDIFPEPDLQKARELLAAGGITLDAVSAHCMRHVVDGIGKIAREAARTGPWDTP